MKKILFPLIGLIISITGMSQVKAKTSSTVPAFKTATDSLQYSVGIFIGAWLKSNGLAQFAGQPFFMKGINDRLKNAGDLNDSLVAKNIDSYKLKVAGENGKIQEQALFAALRAKTDIGILPGGVCYEIITKGTGRMPALADSIVINIKGQTTAGVLVADTYRDKQPATLSVNHLIKGLGDAIITMPEGSKWKVYVPAALAYGKDGLTGLIAPYTALMFEVELIRIKSAIAIK